MAGLGDTIAAILARPVAHRGLHDASQGRHENTLSAVRAAIAGGYGVEIDVQASADGTPVVFHDDTLDRLTDASGPVGDVSTSDLTALAIAGGSDTIPTLDDVLALVGDRTPLLVEIKSLFDGNTALADTVGARLARHAGPVAAMSFDPEMIAVIADAYPDVTRGIVSCDYSDPADWPGLSPETREALRLFAGIGATRPHFIAYDCLTVEKDAPLHHLRDSGLPVLSWTVRDATTQRRIAPFVDQIIFEGFTPT